ncbi:MAG: VOC family protein [Verrucomicrobiales bacterium]|nr:VOC family protein [Verrucomicrobiales bacterium]
MRPKIEGLCPMIQVFDMPASLAFYRDLLGFDVVQQSSAGDQCDWAWLRHGSAELMLNTRYEAANRPPAPDPAQVSAHNDTCFYLGARDVDAMHAFLLEKGVMASSPKVAPYGMKQLYLRDPDGYGICFQWASV